MTRKQRRLALIGLALGGLAVATGLALYALSVLSDTIVYFKTPSDLVAQPVAPATRLRLGGLVEKGSLVKLGGTRIDFAITDTAKSIKVSYDGILPDLFREGEGVVAEGRLDASGVFQADSVLAKHDEQYMPPEVAEALKKQGVWKGGGSN